MAKLKRVKFALKNWRAVNFVEKNRHLEELKKNLDELDLKAESCGHSPFDCSQRQGIFLKIKDIVKVNKLDLKQRARVKWVVDGE